MKKHLLFYLLLSVAGCSGIPQNINAITGFELNRYLGTWYEIARLDHSFERGLDNITATYSLNEDGSVKVINKGRNKETGKWEQAEGKAHFVGNSDQGRLKVSFFGPFYGGYNIIALDKQSYAYAMVTGPDRSYLWVLSRTPSLPVKALDHLITEAKKMGYETNRLIYVEHNLSESM